MDISREDKLIESLVETHREHPRITIGPGDDALAITEIATKEIVLSIDSQKEGIHFKREFLTLQDIGYRSLAGALSDLAAMGADPLTFLVNLEVSPDIKEEDVLEIYRGFNELEDSLCISPSGGNIVRGELLNLTITVVGEVDRGMALRRNGAREGDILIMTGELGKSLSAIKLLQEPQLRNALRGDYFNEIVEKYRHPPVRIKEANTAKRYLDVHACIDISDGLGLDLFRMARAADLEVVIDERDIPVSTPVIEFAKIFGKNPIEIAIESGEEYEIVLAISASNAEKLTSLKLPFKKIGNFRACFEPRVTLKEEDGREIDISGRGYDQLGEDKIS